jgi:hypothetical protein
MKSDIEGKSLDELRRFRDQLGDARSQLGNCCQLGRTPLGRSQYETEREYDDRIRAVSAEIARLERVEREAEEKAKCEKLAQDCESLQSAITALTLFQALKEAMKAAGQGELEKSTPQNLPELVEKLRDMKERL